MIENVKHEMVVNGLLIRLLEIIDEAKGDAWFVVETKRDNELQFSGRYPNIESALERIGRYLP